MHPADQLVYTMRRIYRNGLTTTSGGNLSILDPSGDLWITPGGIDKGALTRSDIMMVREDGSTEGCHKPSLELQLHQAVYKARPDIRAVLHAHSPALMAFSMLRQLPDFSLIPNTRIVCGRVAAADYAIMGSADLADKVFEKMSRGANSVLMDNHGIIVGAENMAQAYKIFETLEFAAASELIARRLGNLKKLSEDQIDIARTRAHTRLSEFKPRFRSSNELDLRREMAMLMRRGLDHQLFYSSQGTISARVDKNTFLITPFGIDRRDIDEEQLVLVKKGLKEAGKTPSRAVFLHELIYHRHPEIQAIIAAQPPNVMAFTITDRVLDAKLMPEPYLLLKELPRAPYGLNYENPQRAADLFAGDVSSIILENDGIITTGMNLTQAFDRLEVAEFTARSVVAAGDYEALQALDDDQMAEIDAGFRS